MTSLSAAGAPPSWAPPPRSIAAPAVAAAPKSEVRASSVALPALTPLAGAAVGVIGTLPWCIAEIVVRPLAREPALAATLLLLGACAGALLGIATSRITDARWLAALLVVPGPLLRAPAIERLIARSVQLTLDRSVPALGLIVNAVAMAVALAVAALLARVAFRSARRLTRRPYVPPLVAAAAFVAVPHGLTWLVDVERMLYLALVVPFVLVVLGWRQRALGAALALAAGAGTTLFAFPYPELHDAAGGLAIGLSILVVRRQWGSRDLAELGGRRAAWPVLASVAALPFVVHALLIGPVTWRSGPTGGVASFLVRLGRTVTDVDLDGFGSAFGTADCAPLEASASPGRHELPGNGFDEDCRDGDPGPGALAWVKAVEAVNAPPPAWRGDIVVVTIDSLRADDAYDLARYPALAELASEGLVFERAYTTASFTSSALPGHFAARLPTGVPMRWLGPLSAVPADPPRSLVHRLSALGYDTALAAGAGRSRYFDADAHGNGFHVSELAPTKESPWALARSALRAWERLDPSRPRFLWVHDLSVHEAPPNRADYRWAIAEIDRALALIRKRIGKDALWIVTADHGEEFGDHGTYRHARTLYEEVARVPLLFTRPGGPRGRVTTVSPLRSLMPTLVAMVDPAGAPPGRGPYLCVGQADCQDLPAPMALELQHVHVHALVVGKRKIVRHLTDGSLFAFDLERDPEERRPIAPVPADLERSLLDWEENAFGATTSEFFWPYEPDRGPARVARTP